MSAPLILGCLWVVVATGVAHLPMRWQFPPGTALLIAAPVLLVWIGYDHGWYWLAVGLFAFGSMFRHPLRTFLFKALGRPVARPKEMQA